MTEEMPSNEQAEKAILGAVLNDPLLFDKILAWIRTPNAFWYNRNSKIWRVFLDLYKKNIPVDVILLPVVDTMLTRPLLVTCLAVPVVLVNESLAHDC